MALSEIYCKQLAKLAECLAVTDDRSEFYESLNTRSHMVEPSSFTPPGAKYSFRDMAGQHWWEKFVEHICRRLEAGAIVPEDGSVKALTDMITQEFTGFAEQLPPKGGLRALWPAAPELAKKFRNMLEA